MLDTSEDGPVNLSKNNELTKEWMIDIQYMIMFKFEKNIVHENTINPLADIFERIYEGKPATHGGSRLRKASSNRENRKKSKRVSTIEIPKGLPGKRKASSTEQRKKKKKLSETLDNLET